MKGTQAGETALKGMLKISKETLEIILFEAEPHFQCSQGQPTLCCLIFVFKILIFATVLCMFRRGKDFWDTLYIKGKTTQLYRHLGTLTKLIDILQIHQSNV